MDFAVRRRQEPVVFALVLDWEDFKVWLSAMSGLSHHDWHLILGLVLTFGLGRLLHRPLGSFVPLGIVLGLELVNEAFDFARNLVPGWPLEYRAAAIDVAITILPALGIVLAARWNSADYYRFRRRRQRRYEVRTL